MGSVLAAQIPQKFGVERLTEAATYRQSALLPHSCHSIGATDFVSLTCSYAAGTVIDD